MDIFIKVIDDSGMVIDDQDEIDFNDENAKSIDVSERNHTQHDYNTMSLIDNIFQNQVTMYTEHVNAVIARNTFKVKEESNIGAIVDSGFVNITNNTFEENKQVKFASTEYLDVIKGVDKTEVLFDINADKSAFKIIEGNRFIVNYVNLNKFVSKFLYFERSIRGSENVDNFI